MNDSPLLAQNYEKYFPFLLEIRKRLMFVTVFFLLSSAVGFWQYERIVRLVLSIFKLDGVNIVFTSPFQFMNLAISCGFFVGIITVFPLIIIQFLSFLKPALRKQEYNTILLLIPVSIILFLFGFSIGAVMMRYVVVLFYERSQALEIGNFLDISRLLSQIIVTSALMGVAFQFPIVLSMLVRFNILKMEQIVKQRMIAWGSSVLFAALLPPTDVFSLVMLTAPLIVLFEITVILNTYVFKHKSSRKHHKKGR